MDFSKNVTFIWKIEKFVAGMLKDGKIDKNDMPSLMLLITELMEGSFWWRSKVQPQSEVFGNMPDMHRLDNSAYKPTPAYNNRPTAPELTNSSTKYVTSEQTIESIYSLYNYIMSHYKLFPKDEGQKAEFKALFDTCLKLVMFQPNINKKHKPW